MTFITPIEILDILFITLAIGFIFSDIFKREPLEGYDPLKFYNKNQLWQNIKFAAMIAAPIIILHEFAHKFVAMAFGATATLHAPYLLYGIVIVLKLARFPLLFLVGGYVSHTPLLPLQSALVSIAGVLTNFLIWLSIWFIIRHNIVNKKYYPILVPMGKISLYLGIFNLIPIPGFDGFNAISSLFRAISS